MREKSAVVKHRDEVDPIARDREGTFVMCFADRLPELYRRGRAGQARRDRRFDLQEVALDLFRGCIHCEREPRLRLLRGLRGWFRGADLLTLGRWAGGL